MAGAHDVEVLLIHESLLHGVFDGVYLVVIPLIIANLPSTEVVGVAASVLHGSFAVFVFVFDLADREIRINIQAHTGFVTIYWVLVALVGITLLLYFLLSFPKSHFIFLFDK